MIDYAKLRAALDAGPTPGPWKVSSMSDYPSAIYGPNNQEVLSGCGCCGSPNLAKKDADHITACDPETIRALLAERDALLDQHHRDSKELRRLCAQRDAARKVSKEAGAIVAGLRCEIDALRYFAESFVEAWEEGMGGDSSLYRQAKAALAQE